MIDILIVHYESTNQRVLKETIQTIKRLLQDEHGLVKMTATKLTEENIEKFKDYNIVIVKQGTGFHDVYNVYETTEHTKLIIDLPYSYLDIHDGMGWGLDNPVDMLYKHSDLLDVIGDLNEDLML
ncbi:hypothetical protein [Staphylococcus phage vB_Sau_P68]|nr:hypothetical protein [Staphylococcus phage vB_Sau_P68]